MKLTKKYPLFILMAFILLEGIVFIFWKYFLERGCYQKTKDAYIAAHVVRIATKVSGYIETLLVQDNWEVKKGELLVKIDSRDYMSRVAAADAIRKLAQTEWLRIRQLSVINALSAFNYDLALATNVITRSILRLESLSLGYTNIYSPIEGKITARSIEEGEYVREGQYLLSIISGNYYWIIGNFKENQLENIRPGQLAKVRIDAYPKKWFRAHVDSVQRGTKGAFSPYPLEDLSLNYVKTTQRIPVKILFDDNQKFDTSNIGPWMTATVEVKTKDCKAVYILSVVYSFITLIAFVILGKIMRKNIFKNSLPTTTF